MQKPWFASYRDFTSLTSTMALFAVILPTMATKAGRGGGGGARGFSQAETKNPNKLMISIFSWPVFPF